jgi:ketosteroid isomerase-like protein
MRNTHDKCAGWSLVAWRVQPYAAGMTTEQNKQLMQTVFAELSNGNSEPFVESLADDVRWTLTGTTAWSRTYDGKPAVQRELLRPLFAQFGDRYTSEATRFTAEDDRVVVEAHGRVTTKEGRPYNNSYCYVFRIADGRVKEITEYFDTQLVATALAPPSIG